MDDSISQKNLMGGEEEWSSQDLEVFANIGDIDMDEGLKPVTPHFSQELLNTPGNSTQESSLGINISDGDLGFSDGGFDKFVKTIDYDDPLNLPSQSVEVLSPPLSQQFCLNPNTYSPYNSQIMVPVKQEPEEVNMTTRSHSRKQVFEQFIPGSQEYPVASSSTHLTQQEYPSQSSSGTQSQDMGGSQPTLADSQSSEVSSSQESSQELPSLVTWKGKYNFSVYPGDPSNPKFCAFSDAKNKLFCVNYRPTLFKMKVDWKNVNAKALNVRAMLVYKSPTECAKPVERCISCLTAEMTNNPELGDTLQHVLRSTHTNARHEKSSTHGRFLAIAPLDKPQPGSDYVAKTYTFMCLSTCKQIRRRDLNLVFTLMENGKQVGRHCFDLKVCACPGRDCDKEDGKVFKSKRKSGNAVEKAAKLRCISPNGQEDPQDGNLFFDQGANANDFNEDLENEQSLMELAAEKIRNIMATQKSPDPSQRKQGKIARRQLRMILETFDYFDGQPPQNLHDGIFESPSPDSGVGAVQTP